MTIQSRARRVSAIVAGVCAMAASFTALGTIIISDVAMAKDSSELSAFADELPEIAPVKMQKVAVKQLPDIVLLEPGDMPQPGQKRRNKKIDFGSFEGY